MKKIWKEFKERWPLAVLGVIFSVVWILINL